MYYRDWTQIETILFASTCLFVARFFIYVRFYCISNTVKLLDWCKKIDHFTIKLWCIELEKTEIL